MDIQKMHFKYKNNPDSYKLSGSSNFSTANSLSDKENISNQKKINGLFF